MRTRNQARRKALLERSEEVAWKKWNRENKPLFYTPEQILDWLDGMRSFMFEVWKKNPSLRKTYEKLNRIA